MISMKVHVHHVHVDHVYVNVDHVDVDDVYQKASMKVHE